VDRTIVLSKNERRSLDGTRENLQQARNLCDQASDRLTPLAWMEPTIDGMGDLAKETLDDMGFAGVKIIPDHWFAHEQRLEPRRELMDELEAQKQRIFAGTADEVFPPKQ